MSAIAIDQGLLICALSIPDFLKTLHLYDNDHVPVKSDSLSAFHEAAFTGYGSVLLTGWSYPAINAAGKAEVKATEAVFTITSNPTSTVNIYGWYITEAGGNVVAAEKFASAPIALTASGQQIKITIYGELSNDPSP